MLTGQHIAAAFIVLLLLGLSLYYGRQQIQSLRWLRGQDDLSDEDRRYYRRQAWLRIGSCSLMLLMALLVGGYYVLGFEARVAALADLVEARRLQGQAPGLDADQQHLGRLFALFIIALLSALMATVILVGIDVWTIRRYGRRQLRQLQAERKDAINSHIGRLRSERNGHI